MKTNSNAYKALIRAYILDSVCDYAGPETVRDKARHIWAMFDSTYNYPDNRRRYPATQARVAEWLAGLPLNIAYLNGDILDLAEAWHGETFEGDPAAEYLEEYRAAVLRVREEAAPLIAAQNLNTFPRRCPDGEFDSVFGSDLYLTAVGHGAGFWDGDWDPIGDELTAIAKRHMPGGSLAEHINGGWFFI